MADVIDAIIAEALGEGPEGMAAVAHVINTRAQQTGKTPEQVVNEAGQFSGVSKPGSSVARSMKDPKVRAQVAQIWNGVTSGKIPNPYPGADYFHTPQVSPSWAKSYDRVGQHGNHIFYASGAKPKSNAAVDAISAAAPTPASGRPTGSSSGGSNWLTYANQSATRSQPLSKELASALSFLPKLGVTAEVFSGGQPAAGQGPRVGSERHDHGNAADVYFYKDGRRLDWSNPNDVPIFQEIVRHGKASGITGFGAGEGYMRPGSMHIGFGKPAVWGAGGKGANAPGWLHAAYNSSGPIPPANIPAKPVQPGGIPGALGGIGAHMGKLGQGALGMFGAGPMKPGARPGSLMAFAGPVMRKAQASIVPNLMGSVAGRTILGKHLMGMNIAPAPAMVPGHRSGGTQAIAINAQGSKPITLMRAATGRGSNQSRAFDSQYHGGQSMDIYRANRAAAGGPITQASINAALGSGRTMVKAKPRYVSSRGDGYSGGTPQSLVG